MGFFKDMFSTFAPAIGTGLGGGLGGAAMGMASKFVGDKIFGLPKPKVGEEGGIQQRDFMDAAFPGTTPWERLGGNSAANAASGVETGKQQERAQSKQRAHEVMLTGMKTSSAERIAANTVSEAVNRRQRVDEPQVPAKIDALNAQEALTLKNTLIAIQKAEQEKNKTALSNEMIKYKRLHALYNLGSSAPHVSQITGTGTVIIKMIEQLDAKLGAYKKGQSRQKRSYQPPGKVTSIPLAPPKKGGWRNFVNKSPKEAERQHNKRNRRKYDRFKVPHRRE